MKRYMRAIERRLNLPREVRNRVMNDLRSSAAARREAGQTDEQIRAEMGTPEAVAAEVNEQMKEYAYTKSKWRWAALTIAVFAGLMLLFEGVTGLLVWLLNLSINSPANVGVIGSADGPTAIFVATRTGVGDWIVWALLVVIGLLLWWKLGHCRKTK